METKCIANANANARCARTLIAKFPVHSPTFIYVPIGVTLVQSVLTYRLRWISHHKSYIGSLPSLIWTKYFSVNFTIYLSRFDDVPSHLSHDAAGREFLRADQTATIPQTNQGSYYIMVTNTGRSDGSRNPSQVIKRAFTPTP